MERQRFNTIEVYYIIAILCLSLSLGLFALSFYILPHLAFGWHYSVPDFVPTWISTLQESYQFGEKATSWVIFLGLFLPALFLAIVADVLSNRIEKKVYHLEEKTITSNIHRRKPKDRESNFLVAKIIMIIVLVFIAAQFFQWIISTSPQP